MKMSKLFFGLLVAGLVFMTGIAGAAMIFQTGFETIDDSNYVLDSDLPVEWGSQCLDFKTLGGTETAHMMIIETNSMASGISPCTIQCDMRFVGAMPGSRVRVRLQSLTDNTGNTAAVAAFQAQGMLRDRFCVGIAPATWSADGVDTDYQIVLSHDSSASPQVNLIVTEDPYGTPVQVFSASEDQITPGPLKSFHLQVGMNR